MNHELGSQLRAAQRMLDKPVRPNKALQEAGSQAMSLLRQRIYDVLDADDDQWLEMIQSYNNTSDKAVRRITVDILIKQLLNSEEFIRARATIWLAAIGRQAIASLGLILLRNHSKKMGVAVAQALGQIASLLSERERMFLMLKLEMGAYRTRHPEVRCACIEAIVQIRRLDQSSGD